MPNSKLLPVGMSTRTAVCGVVATLCLSGTMISSGAQIATRDGSIHIVMAVLGALLIGIALFSAWNAGRASANDGRN